MRRAHRSAHFTIWVALALILPALLIIAFALRGVPPGEPAATRLPDTGATE